MRVELWETITKLHRKYGGRVAHATQVAALVSTLFEKLAPLHGLEEKERTPLLCAAHLHDIGHFVSKHKHHKHSHYLIQHDHLLDEWEQKQREHTALIALNHRKKKLLLPDELKKSRRAKLCACIAVLRMADALDCEHDQRARVLGVTIDRAGRQVTISLQGYDVQQHRKKWQAKASLAEDLWGYSIGLQEHSEQFLLRADTLWA